MNRVLTITAITALSFSSISYAESISAAKAEFYAGSLCMLSQRMAKDYFAIGADIRPEVAMQDRSQNRLFSLLSTYRFVIVMAAF